MRARIMLISSALLLTVFMVVCTGCNTVEGAGEDVQAVGAGVSDASRNVAGKE
jgi:predicted small secreted protein